MAESNPGAEGPERQPAQPEPHPAGTRGQAAKVKEMQAKIQDTIRHHPVVLEQQQRRAQDVQLRIADWITAFAGSMQFVYIHILLFAVWMLVIESKPWPTLTLIVSLEAIFLSTFVLLSQNRESARSDMRSEIDYETNVLSEVWLEAIADNLGIDVGRVYATAQDRIEKAKALQDENGSAQADQAKSSPA